MLDEDLAQIYGVNTKRLNEQVTRNADRFPEDFSFRLTAEEFRDLRSHFATAKWAKRRYRPRVFTEPLVPSVRRVPCFTCMLDRLQHDDVLGTRSLRALPDGKLDFLPLAQVFELNVLKRRAVEEDFLAAVFVLDEAEASIREFLDRTLGHVDHPLVREGSCAGSQNRKHQPQRRV